MLYPTATPDRSPLRLATSQNFRVARPAGGLHFPFAFISVGSRLALAFLFRRNIKPTKPRTTRTAPATINQCGYCIAESMAYLSPFDSASHRGPWALVLTVRHL